MSRAIPFSVAYLLGIVGGIVLIRGSQWGIMVGLEQRHLAVEQIEKAGG
jgi:hypothetical protein